MTHSSKASFGNRAFRALAVLVSLGLIFAHAWPHKPPLTIDSVTLGLLAFAALPFLGEIVSSFKAGGVEFELREKINDEQVFPFLLNVASKQQWTFFAPRQREAGVGLPFKILTLQLLETVEEKFTRHLRLWLRSGDPNVRWFAAEVIGYHRLQRLHRAVVRAAGQRRPNERWDAWDLNCRWAAARLDPSPATAFGALLSSTTHPDNVYWILKSFEQMLLEPNFLAAGDRELLLSTTRAYLEQNSALCAQDLPELRQLAVTGTAP